MSKGDEIFQLAKEIEFFPRSLIGDGVRQTLEHFKKILPQIEIHSLPSGSMVGDWTIPNEWKIYDAWIETPDGCRICEYAEDPLHVVFYSEPIDKVVSKEELMSHLHTHPLPDAIPYVTSYYHEYWGFCLSKEMLESLPDGDYRVYISSEKLAGSLNFAELIIPGINDEEILLTSYVCHPYTANNELSGPCLLIKIAEELCKKQELKNSYRIALFPETIGSIAYISERREALKNIVFGNVLSCVGDEGAFSYLPSKEGNSAMDRIIENLAKSENMTINLYGWDERGSDERQFNWPTVNLPTSCFSKTKFHEYPEYHSNLDRLGTVVTSEGLDQSYRFYMMLINCLEYNQPYISKTLGEPFLSKHNLYPRFVSPEGRNPSRDLMNILSFCDGFNKPIDIAEKCGLSILTVIEQLINLSEKGLVSEKS